jgi:hypothetical protein
MANNHKGDLMTGEKETTIMLAFLFLICIIGIFLASNTMIGFSAARIDVSNIQSPTNLFPWELIIPHQRSYAENESHLKLMFDGNMNYDQYSVNRGIDFSICYQKDNGDLYLAENNNTHYTKIRGKTPEDALSVLQFPAVKLKAGFSIPDPDRLYISKFQQIAPDEYKIWVITKTPAVVSANGTFEKVCQINYWY